MYVHKKFKYFKKQKKSTKRFLINETQEFGVKRCMFGSDWPVCMLASPEIEYRYKYNHSDIYLSPDIYKNKYNHSDIYLSPDINQNTGINIIILIYTFHQIYTKIQV